MKRKTNPQKIGRAALAALAVLLFVDPTHAEPSVKAKVSATQISLSGSITLVIEVAGVNNVGPAPDLTLPDFQVQRAGQTSSYQWINGQSSSLVAFNYVLSPMKTGTLQIPSITLNSEGKSYKTDAIQISVAPDGNGGAAQGMPGELPNKSVSVPSEGLKPFFITANVDTQKAYVGQQILLRVQFLRRPDLRLAAQPRYIEPDTTGFLVEPLKQQEYMTTLNGTQYAVTELPYALFPTSDGEFTIGSAQIELAMRRQVDPFDPDSFFQNFFGRSETARLSTRALPIQVRALPKNKPPTFSGTVGRFKISAKIDAGQPEVGKPFNLIIKVEGVGNINAIKEPFIPDLRGFRRYETISSSNLSKDGKFLHGSKEFKILLIPQVSGPLVIPPIPFVFFNPAENDYETETTSEISMSVKPGTLSETQPEVTPKTAGGTDTTEGIRVVEKNIRFMKFGTVHRISKSPQNQGWFWIAISIPPLFAFVAFLVDRRARKKIEQPTLFRSRNAFRKSISHLKKVKKKGMLSDSAAFYGDLSTILTGFLADKFDVSASGLKWDEIERRLLDKKMEPSMLTQIREILDEADMARFATSSFDDQNREGIIKKTEALLILLNKTI